MKKEDLYKNKVYAQYLEHFVSENRVIRFNEVLKNRTKHFCVAVEDLYQLHNTSAVMRSCEVFGIQDLHVIEQRFAKQIDKEIALGAEKWVDIHRHKNNKQCLEILKAQGYQIVATTPHVEANYLKDFNIEKPSAIFFGTEKSGLSEDIMNAADAFIKIPMVGFTESLNISVSAAIILQNLTERLRASSKINWQLTKEQKLEKQIDWLQKSIKDIDFITERFIEEQS